MKPYGLPRCLYLEEGVPTKYGKIRKNRKIIRRAWKKLARAKIRQELYKLLKG